MSPLKILIDVVGGGALAFLLLLVILVDKFTAPPSVEATPGPNTLEVRNVTDAANQAPPEPKKLRLAVLTDRVRMNDNQMVIWDDMGSLLNKIFLRYVRRYFNGIGVFGSLTIRSRFVMLKRVCSSFILERHKLRSSKLC